MRCQWSPPSFGKQAGNGGHGKVPSNDGSASDHVPLVRAQAIEPLVQQGMDSRRDAEHALSTFVSGDRRHLLEEERIALGGDADLLPQLGREVDLGREADEQRFRVRAREWLECKRVHIRMGRDPGRAPLHEFGTGEDEYEDGSVAAPSEDVFDEVEQRRLGPVQVLEADDEWSPARKRLERPANGPEGLLGRCSRA